MLPHNVISNSQRIDHLIATIDTVVDDADFLIQNVYANHIVLAGSGYVEKAVLITLSEYGRTHGNKRIARYLEKTVSRHNSLNCEKIEKILNQFDPVWWRQITQRTSQENTDAVDSLKNLRDQIAHGKTNGTGYTTVKNYYTRAKAFAADFAHIICQ